jgi:hypothetical protein
LQADVFEGKFLVKTLLGLHKKLISQTMRPSGIFIRKNANNGEIMEQYLSLADFQKYEASCTLN